MQGGDDPGKGGDGKLKRRFTNRDKGRASKRAKVAKGHRAVPVAALTDLSKVGVGGGAGGVAGKARQAGGVPGPSSRLCTRCS